MNSSIHIHIYTFMYTRDSYSQPTAAAITFFKRPRSLQRTTRSPRARSLARSLASVRYSSFIAHVHGKCSANGKRFPCIDPVRHWYPRQSRWWTWLYRHYTTSPIPLQSTQSRFPFLRLRRTTTVPIRYSRASDNSSPLPPHDIKLTWIAPWISAGAFIRTATA